MNIFRKKIRSPNVEVCEMCGREYKWQEGHCMTCHKPKNIPAHNIKRLNK